MNILRKRKEPNRRIVVCLSDLHAGHKLGLCNPETILWDEGPDGEPVARKPTLGATQRYLWRLYQLHIEQVRELVADDEIVLLHNGDLTHGTRFIEGVTSAELDDHIQTGFWNLAPWFDLPNVQTMRLLLGTGVHTFNGSSEAIIARLLRGQFPGRSIKAVSHALLTVGGVSFDVAHHGPGAGSRNWLKGNVARYYLRSVMATEIEEGRPPPRVVLRAHYHTYIREYLEHGGHVADLVITPSYCGMNGHGRKATQSAHLQTHGLVAFEIVEGELCRIIPMKETLDLRTRETI